MRAVWILVIAGCAGSTAGTLPDATVFCNDDEQCPVGQVCSGGVCTIGVDAGPPPDAMRAPAEIVVDPTTLDFGNALLGVDTTLSATITNIGEADLHVTSITVFEPDALPEYAASPSGSVSITIPGGGSATVAVTLRPEDDQIDVGELRIASDDQDEPQVVVSLVSDLKGTPDLDVTPPNVDYGIVSYGTTTPRDVDVVNAGSGNAPLVITNVYVTNDSGEGMLYTTELFEVLPDGTEVPATLPVFLSAGDATTPADILRVRLSFYAFTFSSGPAPDEDLVLVTNDPDPAEAEKHIPISGTVFGCDLPEPEVCNGLDDDCDLEADEGDPGSGATCSTGDPGICGPGVEHCVSGAITCVPDSGPMAETCNNVDDDCDGSTDDGLIQTCYNACGTAGVEFCVAGGWVGCNAPPPPAETCNMMDDDCDGMTDEGFNLTNDINNCGSCGNVCNVPNATETCSSSMCAITSCTGNFVDVNATYSDGCECADDAGEASAGTGDTCPASMVGGTLTEGGTTTLSGKIATPGDEDWWEVTFTDNADAGGGACDVFRPNITFSSNPGNAYRFQVYNTDCTARCTGAVSDFKYYSGPGTTNHCCYNIANPGPGGESCADQSFTARVRVYRTAGDGSCDTYTLLVKNGP